MINGVEDPQVLADLTKGRLRDKGESLEEAHLGIIGPHQRRMLRSQLSHLDFLDREIAMLDKDISASMGPYQGIIEQIDTVHGIGQRGAEETLVEISPHVVSHFPSAHHLASWAKVCPGNNESAGKRKI